MSSSSLPPHPNNRCGLIGEAASASLTDLDWRILRAQLQLKNDLPERPKQTGFRVFSVITYIPELVQEKQLETDVAQISKFHPYDNHQYVELTDEKLAFVTGTNTEVRTIDTNQNDPAWLCSYHVYKSDLILHSLLLCLPCISSLFSLVLLVPLFAVSVPVSFNFA